MITLSDSQVERFSRQIILPEIGAARQEALINGKATIVAGGVALSVVSVYLAAAGVGRLDIVPAQSPSAGEEGEDSPPDRLADHNPEISVKIHEANDWPSAIAEAGVVVAANTTSLGKLSGICRSAGVPLLWGESVGATLVGGADVPQGACSGCARAAASGERRQCDRALAGASESLLASILAAEATKVLAGLGSALAGRVLVFDSVSWLTERREVKPQAGCPLCGSARCPRSQ